MITIADAVESRRFLWIPCGPSGHASKLGSRYTLRFLRTHILLKESAAGSGANAETI